MHVADGSPPRDETAPFDPQDFERRLMALNPWAETGLKLGEPEFDLLDRPENEHTRRLCVARQIVNVARLRGTAKAFNDWSDGMGALRNELAQHGHWPSNDHATDDAARLARRWAFLATIDIQKLSFDDALDCTGFRFPHTFQAQSATFRGNAGFQTANFESVTAFTDAVFDGRATFQAIQSKRAFSLARAEFFEVPDFIQAEFSEAPRPDNLHIRRPVVRPRRFWWAPPDSNSGTMWSLPQPLQLANAWVSDGLKRARVRLGGEDPAHIDVNVTAQCRALRGIANAAHDPDREAEYRALEIRMARFNEDWPLPLRPYRWKWKDEDGDALDYKSRDRDLNSHIWAHRLPLNFWDGRIWAGFVRFWLGWAYGVLSDFGRSVIRPAAFWCVLVAVFTCVYLSGHPEYDARRGEHRPPADASWVGDALISADVTVAAWRHGFACVERDQPNIVALKPEVRAGTNAFWQALRMSLANAVVFGDLGGTEGARLAYGCLYGLERLQPARSATTAEDEKKRSWFTTTYLPPDMLWATRLQKLLAAVLIFLFGLALRNLLKVK